MKKRVLLLIIFILSLFCFTTSGYSDDSPSVITINDNIIKTKNTINGIHYLEFKQQGIDPSNITIIVHPLGSNKELFSQYWESLVFKDQLLIVLDIYTHGEDNNIGSFPDIIVNTTGYINTILDQYNIENYDNINMIGCSLGGLIAPYYVCNGKYHIDKLCNMIGTPVFTTLEDEMFYKIYQHEDTISEGNRIELESIYRDISPENRIDKLNNTEILFMNSRSDPYMDYNSIENIVQYLSNARLIELEQDYHGVVWEDFITAMEFIGEDS